MFRASPRRQYRHSTNALRPTAVCLAGAAARRTLAKDCNGSG
jgi:hypothetical protein